MIPRFAEKRHAARECAPAVYAKDLFCLMDRPFFASGTDMCQAWYDSRHKKGETSFDAGKSGML